MLFKRVFWTLVFKLAIVLAIELMFCFFFLLIVFVIYMVTEQESLNSYTSTIFYKCFLSLPPLFYNAKHFIIAYRHRDYIKAIGFIGITALYLLFVWTLGGGGR
jgi:ABC-type dipeptide/oligopeptide/nickel transport system permease subunit